MNDELKQKLSSLMDGEIDNHADPAISKLMTSESLRKTWWRYHLIADALNGILPEYLDRDLADKIAREIAKEPTPLSSHRFVASRLLRPAAGFAIAASVAAIAIFGIQQNSVRTPESPPVQIADTKPPQFNANFSRYTFPVSTNAVSSTIENAGDVEPNPRMNSYLVNYNELRTSQTGVQGIIPYVRIIANDDDQ
ncbi:MAG: anti sigma-E protein, RseA [Gammaproteobacteria bacterium]|nr:anti sigma-E protein, RseA [Gammaproteobacteria bacterium]